MFFDSEFQEGGENYEVVVVVVVFFAKRPSRAELCVIVTNSPMRSSNQKGGGNDSGGKGTRCAACSGIREHVMLKRCETGGHAENASMSVCKRLTAPVHLCFDR